MSPRFHCNYYLPQNKEALLHLTFSSIFLIEIQALSSFKQFEPPGLSSCDGTSLVAVPIKIVGMS